MMYQFTIPLTLACLAFLGCQKVNETTQISQPSHQHEMITAQNIQVESPIIRAPLPGRTTAMGTMVLKNNGPDDDTLIAVKAPISQNIEIHTMRNEDGIMKMRRLENGIKLPAGGSHVLKGGSDHIMLFNTVLESDMKSVPVTLIFEKAGAVDIIAQIYDGSMDHHGH